jgi:rhodanese-related sulfurtransferase
MNRHLVPVHGPLAALALFTGCATTSSCEDASRVAAVEAMYADYRTGFDDVPELGVAELQVLTEQHEVLLVDVREAAEQAVSMIPGALTLDEFLDDSDAHRDVPIIVYCTIGARSADTVRWLAGEGFDAYNLAHGILGWTHAGEPLATPAGEPTEAVHVYGAEWDLAACRYTSTW